MGSRATQTLTEIEQIRGDLEAKITELGTRLPPAVRMSKRVLAGVGGGGALFVLSRIAGRVARRTPARAKRRTSARAKAGTPEAPIVVKTSFGGPAIVGAAAIWAAVRVYEIKIARERRAAPVRDLRPSA